LGEKHPDKTVALPQKNIYLERREYNALEVYLVDLPQHHKNLLFQ
jgi:hypothetical protein